MSQQPAGNQRPAAPMFSYFQTPAPVAGNWRKKLFVSVVLTVGILLAGIGTFAQMGWLPQTDPVSGRQTGWFGREVKADNSSGSFRLNSANPPLPTNTPTLSKEYIYAGSRLLAVEDAQANAAPPADLAVWRPSNGTWYILNSQQQWVTQPWGTNGDEPAPGDYDGDGKTDFCVFRTNPNNPAEGDWYVIRSSDGGSQVVGHGNLNDKPAPADFDGDGKTDYAVWRESNTTWYILQSSNNQVISNQFGATGDKPTPADFDGDGKADWAVWRSNSAQFWVKQSTNNQIIAVSLGQAGDTAVVGDYDGDGKADYATYRSDNVWRILQSSNNQQVNTTFGRHATDTVVPNDYDGDGKCDLATWTKTGSLAGVWHIRQSGNNQLREQQWGVENDIPVPAFWRR